MGRIGKVESAENVDIAGAKVKTVYVDTGGELNLTGDVFGTSGVDSLPVESDYAILVPVPGGFVCVGFADPINEGEKDPGEIKINGRDADANIVSYIELNNDGDINIISEYPIGEENSGNIRLENANGYMILRYTGQLDVNGNFTVDP